MRLEEFFELHKDQLKVSSPEWGYPVPKSKRNKVRFLGTDEYVLIEIDKQVWVVKHTDLLPPTPVPPTGLVTALDVSSHQPRNLTRLIQQFAPSHVIVKLYLRGVESIPQAHSIEQAESARQNGCTVGGYVWCYRTVNAEATITGALETAEKASIRLPILWLDLEEYNGQPGPSIAWIHEAIHTCEFLGVRAGIYTAAWYWNKWHPSVTDFGDANVPLWAAQYTDIVPTSLDSFIPFGGWTKAAAIQWTSTPVDQNIINSELVTV